MIPITAQGRLGKKPELGFTPTGHARASFGLATSKRVRADDGSWSDGPTTWLNVTAWRDLAEALTEADLAPGTELIVAGELAERTYTTKAGEERRSMELTAKAIAPVLSPRQVVTVRRGITRSTTSNDEWGTL